MIGREICVLWGRTWDRRHLKWKLFFLCLTTFFPALNSQAQVPNGQAQSQHSLQPIINWCGIGLEQGGLNAAFAAQMAKFNPAACPVSIGGPIYSGPGTQNAAGITSNLLGQSGKLAQSLIKGGGFNSLECLDMGNGCPEPSLSLERHQFQCEDLPTDKDKKGWDAFFGKIHQSECAASCKETAAQQALNSMNCLKNQFTTLKDSFEGLARVSDQLVTCEKSYLTMLDQEIQKEQRYMDALIGSDGQGGFRARLAAAQQNLQNVVANYEAQIPICTQAIKKYQQDQELYTQAIQRAVVERGSSCFFNSKPRETNISNCPDGSVPDSMYKFIMCRYEIDLQNKYRRTDGVQRGNQRARQQISILKARLESTLNNPNFVGDGEVTLEAATSKGQQRQMDEAQFKNLLNTVLSQTGNTSTSGATFLDALEKDCFTQSQNDINKEVSATGSNAFNLRRRNEDLAVSIMSGAATTQGGEGFAVSCGKSGILGMTRDYQGAIDQAAAAMGRSENTKSLPAYCFSTPSVSNNGQVNITNNNLNQRSDCVQKLQVLSAGLLQGNNLGTQAFQPWQLPVPVQPPIMCAGFSNCLSSIDNAVTSHRNNLESLNGDSVFTNNAGCSQGCPGRKRYIKDSNQVFKSAMQSAADKFSDQTASMRNQVDAINRSLSHMGMGTLDLSSYTKSQWDCPTLPEGETLCKTPDDMASILGGMVAPPAYRDGSQQLSQKINELSTKLGELKKETAKYGELTKTASVKVAECRKKKALGSAKDFMADLDERASICTSPGGSRDLAGCNHLADLEDDWNKLKKSLSDAGDDGREAKQKIVRKKRLLYSLCGKEDADRQTGQLSLHMNYCKDLSQQPDAAPTEPGDRNPCVGGTVYDNQTTAESAIQDKEKWSKGSLVPMENGKVCFIPPTGKESSESTSATSPGYAARYGGGGGGGGVDPDMIVQPDGNIRDPRTGQIFKRTETYENGHIAYKYEPQGFSMTPDQAKAFNKGSRLPCDSSNRRKFSKAFCDSTSCHLECVLK